MKIVHIITRLILGGAQENTLITCKLLAQRGHDVTLITGPAIGPEGELFNQTKQQNYKVIVVDRLRRAINPFNDAISYLQIKKLLHKLQPDIVHTHSAKAGILGRFAGYSLKGKAAIIERKKIEDHLIKQWQERVIQRVSKRVIADIKKERGTAYQPEVNFPAPQYLIEVVVEEVVDLTPGHLKP